MMAKTVAFFSTVCLCLAVSADWICTESAGVNSEGVYQICGIGEHQFEAEARSAAFNAAKAEFDRVCNEDQICRNQGKSVILKRTDCQKSTTGYKCYRMLEYRLTEKKVSAVDRKDLEKELLEKQNELEDLKKQSFQLERLKLTKNEIELEKMRQAQGKSTNPSDLQERIDQLSVDLENDYLQITKKKARNPNWVFRLGIVGSGSTLDAYNYNLAGYRLGFEHRLTSILGVSVDIDPQSTGSGSTNDKYSSSAITVGVPIYLYQSFYLRPELIQRQTRQMPQSGPNQDINQSGYGASTGYDFLSLRDEWTAGLSINIGFHSYGDNGSFKGKSSLSGSVGLAIGW